MLLYSTTLIFLLGWFYYVFFTGIYKEISSLIFRTNTEIKHLIIEPKHDAHLGGCFQGGQKHFFLFSHLQFNYIDGPPLALSPT